MCYDDDGFDHDDDDDGNNKVCLNIGSYDVWWFQLLLMTMMIVGWYMDLDIGIVNPIILLQLIGFDFSFIILIKFILSYHFFFFFDFDFPFSFISKLYNCFLCVQCYWLHRSQWTIHSIFFCEWIFFHLKFILFSSILFMFLDYRR